MKIVGSPNASTGMKGRAMSCTGNTTGGSSFDPAFCTLTTNDDQEDASIASFSIGYVFILSCIFIVLLVGVMGRIKGSRSVERQVLGLELSEYYTVIHDDDDDDDEEEEEEEEKKEEKVGVRV